MKHKTVWIMSGLPGSGKTTWVHKFMTEYDGVHCSRDEVRFSIIKEDEEYFSHENEVFETWVKQINEAIANPNVANIYVDATHLNDKSRKKILNRLTKDIEYEILFVILDVALDICLKRNEQRKGRAYVPPEVIRNMYKSFETTTKLGPQLTITDNGKEED